MPTSNTISEAQARLDDEIAALTLVLCNLRTQRNTLSHISRLPPEILASIFIHCARNCQQNRYFEPSIPDWVNVSYVCRHWRDVALNCSTLWSFLFVSSHNWTNELLARSKEAPLRVCIDSEYPKQSKELYLLERVAPQARRIQDLCLRLTRREAERILSMFSSGAPLLQTLRVCVERSNYLAEPALVSGPLFQGDIPALRKLELTNYAVPLSSLTLCRLTTLRLRDLGASCQLTLAELQVALSRMQNLAHLHLENALPSAIRGPTGWSFEGPDKLSFPRLSRLSVVAPFSTVVLLLSCLDIPLKTDVRLRCCFEAGLDDRTQLYPLLAKRFTAFQGQASLVPTLRTCFIATSFASVGFVFSATELDSGRRSFSADTTSYELGQLYEDWDCNIPLKIDIVLQTALSRDREDLIENICRCMPLSNLQSLQINFDTETTLSSAFWMTTFGHLGELRHMKLSQVNLQGLVHVLSLSQHHPARQDVEEPHSNQTFAPALKELELHNVDFSRACYGRLQGNPTKCSCSAQCLRDALLGRQTDGYGLQRLVFIACMYVRDYDVESLKEFVTDVSWDGVTRTIPEPEEDEVEVERGQRPRGRSGITWISMPSVN